jgi:general secretion pathway protein A
MRYAILGKHMYESFYGLKENPFRMTPDPKFLYLGANHKEALAQLWYGVREQKGFIVITGEVGTGKTTLVHSLLDRLNGNGSTKTALLFNPKLDVNDFLQYILKDFGVKVRKGSKGDHLQALHKYLLETYENNGKVVLIVDEAQTLDPELLEELRLLSNLETSKSKLLQIILLGQPELNKTLSRPEFRQLKQRINLRYHIPPLTREETNEYIERRLKIAGAQGPLFTKKAVKEIYEKSGGIPRLINILCDNALLNGYASDQKKVDETLVKEAAKDLELATKSFQGWIWIILGILMAMGIFLLFYVREEGSLLPFFSRYRESLQYLKEDISKTILSLYEYITKGA